MDSSDGAPAGRSAAKRQAIVDAARDVFLRNGYGRASMDEIAALAAVSKQTVYKHFADKQRLFSEIIASDIDRAETQSSALVEALGDSDDPEADLRTFARRHVAAIIQPHLLRTRRIIISEAERFPDLARTWYEQGPERAYTSLAEQFTKLAQRGYLRIDDPLLATQNFNWLVLSIPLNKAMFFGSDTRFTRRELQRYADEGVRVFLAAYGNR
jgi:TetR/AcrR family transcriptional repressor of mexJK operon